MKRKTSFHLSVPLSALALLLFTSLAPAAWAAEARGTGPKIEIVAPQDGAKLDAGESYPLQYAVIPGVEGDHFHVWVDSERGPGVHTLKGTYDLPKMTAGEH